MYARLTTVDNPYNPFTQFEDWFAYDTQMGYNTCSYLARLARTSSSLSTEDYWKSIEDAIDRIVDLEPDFYKKIITNE